MQFTLSSANGLPSLLSAIRLFRRQFGELDQLVILQSIFFFILITSMLDIEMIL